MKQNEDSQFSLKTFLQIDSEEDPLKQFIAKQQQELQNIKMQKINYITSDQQFQSLLDCQNVEVIGVDVEYNKKKGYYGQICLIQISIQQQVFILNVQKLDKLMLQKDLNPLFQSENIIKVFYGGYQDILWLQQCLNIMVHYPVFDIKIAAEYLNKKFDNSLINLWSTYCSFEFEKQKKKLLQQSDWSLELTQEQIEYAGLDAFYLPQLRVLLLKKIMENKGIQSLKKLDSEQRNSFKEIDFGIDMHTIQDVKILKWCQKELLSMTNKLDTNKFLRMDNYLKCIVFIFIKLVERRKTMGQVKNLNPTHEIESDESLLQFVLNYFLNQEQNSFIVQGQLQLNSESQELEEIIEQIEQRYQKIEEWQEIKLQMMEDLYNFIIKSQGTADYVISEMGNIAYSQKQKDDINRDRKQRKKERFLQFQDKYSCQKPVYSNCKILSPDNIILCNCDESKVKWYLSKNLATKVSDNPLIIKLNFQPSGVGHSELQEELDKNELQFYSTDRNNQCVVCGQTNHYLKYHIVPMLYRRFFPNSFKSHRSHDVILLCVRCHEKANATSDKLKFKVAEQYNVPYVQHSEQKQQLIQIENLAKIAKQYTQQHKNWNKEVRQKMKSKIRQQYQQILDNEKIRNKLDFPDFERNKNGEVKVNETFLEFCIDLSNQKNKIKEKSNQDFKNIHGKHIVEQLKSEEDLKDFIKIWRRNFLDEMQPQFLPEAWSLEHKFTRNFGEKSVYNDKSDNQL